MQNIIINEELRNLLPPLTAEEYAGLEASILKDGVLSPLIVWNDTLVDGHYRHAICMEHGITFPVKKIVMDNLDEAKRWAWRHQEHRRNMTAFQRAELALKLKDIIAAKAKERQRRSNHPTTCVMDDQPVNTNKILGEMAGVSSDTFRKVKFLVNNASPETCERLRNGEKGTSIHREYMRIHPAGKPEEPRTSEESNPLDRPATTAEKISKWLLNHRSAVFIRELLLRMLCDYRDRYGKEEGDIIHRHLCQAYDEQ